MAVTQLPTPPQRSDPATFAERGDAFMSALPTFQAEINALQITTNAQTAADAAASATSAAEAVVAKNAAIAAWAASMSPAETLPALSQSLHIGAVVKAIVYDTSKDSDGGAWRKRCADKSWYTETLGGDRWIGQHATISAAWTAAGSTTGAVYQASATAGSQTSGLFYTPTSSTTVTQVYRGVTREFPAVAGIVAESARVVIYDLATGAMWMVFTGNQWGGNGTFMGTGYSGTTISSVAMQGGDLLIGLIGTYATGMSFARFVKDSFGKVGGTGNHGYGLGIANRRSVTGYRLDIATAMLGDFAVALVNNTVNDVAITVLDSSPIDPATGLPVPTIAVATAGGVSVIKDDGTVVSTVVSTVASASVSFDAFGRLFISRGTAATNVVSVSKDYTTSTAYDPASIPALFAAQSGQAAKAIGAKNYLATAYSTGLQVLKENPATVAKGMVAYITTAYNTGWLPGDIRGAYLADTTAETVTASGELVTNGTFTSDITGWTDQTSTDATPSWNAGKLRLTRDTLDTPACVYQAITTVIGKTYFLSVDIVSTCTTFVRASTTSGSTGDLYSSGTISTGTTVKTGSFTATGTTTYISAWAYQGAATTTADFDNISVKLAEPDRSVKNKGLVVNGSLTKTAVASGAGLVSYSGFSAANYIEQPYNSDFDFGTGDFCVMGWVKRGSGTESFIERNSVSAGAHLLINATATNIYVYGSADLNDYTMVSAAYALSTTNYKFVAVFRQSGTAYLYVDGLLVASAASSVNITNSSAVLRIGNRVNATTPSNGSLALWRISATAPSADQIAHIYRTELPLFQASAQCTIAGTSTAVTALAYDDTTELLHVGTSWGRTGFKDLLRVDSEATTTGALTSLSASQGVIITGGTSGKVYVPAMLLRDELRRKDEARKALGKVPVFQEFDAVTSQVAFVVAKGYTVKAVYSAGTLKRLGASKDYTVSDDGFQETITFAVAPGNTVWVSAMTVRK